MSRRADGGEKPRVFISHSAIDDPPASALLPELQRALEPDYAVLVDRDLKPGSGWRQSLNTWMGACDASVVLLTEKALRSEFVAYEVSILTYRAKYVPDKKCKVIPVFMHPVDARRVQAAMGFGPGQISETEAIKGAHANGTPKTQEEIIAEVAGNLAGIMCADTPLDEQEIFLENLFSSPGFPPPKVEQALKSLGVRLDGWNVNPFRSLALALLSRGLDDTASRVIDQMRGYVRNPEDLRLLFDLVALSWIDLRSVRCLAGIATGSQKSRVVALNASSDLIARKYVHRAGNRPPNDPWPVAPVTATDLQLDVLKREIEAALRNAIKLDESADVHKYLQRLETKLKKPVFVALPAAAGVSGLLENLRSSFETVTFFLLAGEDEPALRVLQEKEVELLEPRLPNGFESSFIETYTEMMELLVGTWSRQ